jgi:excisionase family DNA binding protein
VTITEARERPTLSVPEAAELLGVSRSAAYEAAKRGQIPCITIGRSRRVVTAKLLDALGLNGHDDVAICDPNLEERSPTDLYGRDVEQVGRSRSIR